MFPTVFPHGIVTTDRSLSCEASHEVLRAVLEALDIPHGATVHDQEVRDAILVERVMHVAAMLKRSGGVPAFGNQRAEWDAACRADFPNPEHR